MHLIGLARLGRDSELRFLQDGTPVLNLALAFNYGKKDGEGKRPTQWVDATLWGERGERAAPHLLKGTLILAHLSDPHIETYQRNGGGEGFKLVARLDTFEFAGGGQNQQQGNGNTSAPRQSGATADQYSRAKGGPAPSQQRRGGTSGFDDLEDSSIPF